MGNGFSAWGPVRWSSAPSTSGARGIEETSGADTPHLSLAALSEPAQPSRTKRSNGGSSRDAALDPAIASAVEHERRRIAADVHDLIMQDLALALAQARMLADDTPKARTVVDAGERALAGARDLVGGLSARGRSPIASAVTLECSPGRA